MLIARMLAPLALLAAACPARQVTAPVRTQEARAVAVEVAGPVCTTGWCWMNPRPQGHGLESVWVKGKHMWAVGDEGTVLHHDGKVWTSVGLDGAMLESVFATSPENVWTVGDKAMAFHGSGGRWTRVVLPVPETVNLSAVWGTSETNIWASGAEMTDGRIHGKLLRYDGTSWKLQTVPDLTPDDKKKKRGVRAVHGSGPDNIWIVGDEGMALRWDGKAWSATAPNTIDDLKAVFVSAPDDVWVASPRQLYHWDGAKWTMAATPTMRNFTALWGTSGSDVWAIGMPRAVRWDGKSWRNETMPSTARAIAGVSTDDLWIVGDSGLLSHRVEGEWVDQRKPLWMDSDEEEFSPSSIGGSGPKDIWIGSGNMRRILHGDGRDWVVMRIPIDVTAIWANSPTDAWAVGSDDDRAAIVRWDGTQWKIHYREDRSMTAIWGRGPDDMWVAGDEGLMLRFDGERWNPVRTKTEDGFYSIFGTASGDLWAVGASGLLWNGREKRLIDTGTSTDLYAVWGTAADDVWIATYDEGLLHWNGKKFEKHDKLTGDEEITDNLYGVWGNGRDDVWAVGSTLLHYDGRQWTRNLSLEDEIEEIWGTGRDMWVTGNGILLRRAALR
jgi:hypothetical protein